MVPVDTFTLVNEKNTQDLKAGQIIIRNIYLSLDPAMRSWMKEGKSYIEPVKIGDVMRGGTLGEVVESKNSSFKMGDLVSCWGGWQEYFISDGKGVQKIPQTGLPLKTWLGALGMTGMTAYFGLLDIGKPKSGETVLVSGAAGATGSVVGQIAKQKGCRVVGIAGSQEKCDWLVKELGFDAAVNYKDSKNLYKDIKQACPKGVDVFFDNVGGDILDIALAQLNLHGRIVVCGAISQYGNAETKGPKNYMMLLVNRARMEGFVVFDFAKRFGEAIPELAKWIKEGKLKYHEQVIQGLEKAPESLNLLFSGQNSGKLLIQISSESKPNSKL